MKEDMLLEEAQSITAQGVQGDCDTQKYRA